ncbi:MAG: hypothetical protein N4A47_00450 [Clostridia bacterium]|jgi:hypothetical protein|nr:hypothetical protein [Clostridia bacterium]
MDGKFINIIEELLMESNMIEETVEKSKESFFNKVPVIKQILKNSREDAMYVVDILRGVGFSLKHTILTYDGALDDFQNDNYNNLDDLIKNKEYAMNNAKSRIEVAAESAKLAEEAKDQKKYSKYRSCLGVAETSYGYMNKIAIPQYNEALNESLDNIKLTYELSREETLDKQGILRDDEGTVITFNKDVQQMSTLKQLNEDD